MTTDHGTTLRPGTQIGQYTVVAFIGAGAMGEVYRATDPRLGREIAIKVLPRELASDGDRLNRLEHEARAAGRLNHPNLLTVHELGIHDGSPFIVTELLEGRSLREVLDSGPLPIRKVVDYGVEIANGLSAAHDKGIIHRDLKPENIFVTTDGRVKILDFGLAKFAASREDKTGVLNATESGAVLGTPGYVSPEHLRNEPVDARSDLFALGAILYEMLVGRRAFRGDSRVETLHSILKDDPPEMPGVPQPLQRVVRHCLEKHPAERFHCAHDLAFALESSYGLADDDRGQRSRSRLLPVLAAAIALLIVAMGAWMLMRRKPGAWPTKIERLTFTNGEFTNARFTGDRTTIVYSLHPGKDTDVYAVRTDHPESKPLGFHDAVILSVSRGGELLLQLHGVESERRWGITSGTLARVYLTGSVPREVLSNIDEADWDPAGSKIAITRFVGGKCRIEFPAGHVLYETAGWASHIRVSPDGRAIAFIDHPIPGDDAGAVAVVALDREFQKLSRSYNTAQGLAWRPDGSEVWFTAGDAQRSLRAIDRHGRERILYVAPGLMTLNDVSAEGRALVTLASHEMKIAFSRANDPHERDLSWRSWSGLGDLSSDGALMVFTEGFNELYVRRTDGSPAVKIGDGWHGRFSPDGKLVLAISPRSQLIVFPVAAGEPRQITNDSLQHERPCWMPDGKRVLFEGTDGRSRHIFMQSLAGGSATSIAPEGLRLANNAASPDGENILVLSGERIGLLSTKGGQPRMLPDVLRGTSPLQWNRQGTGFYFTRGGSLTVYEYELASQQIRQLPYQLRERKRNPSARVAITPDGRAYAVDYPSVIGDLYVLSGVE